MNRCISYPKSGRSWLRYMLTHLEPTLAVEFQHDGFEFNDGTMPPHSFGLDDRRRRYAPEDRIVYLSRDPRDVMVSLYHQVTGRFRDFFDYEGDLSAFIRDPYFGADVLARFRTMWSELAAERGYLQVSYEDLHANNAAVLRRVAEYWGATTSAESIARAIDAGRFERMREVEAAGSFGEPWLRLRNGAPKVRRGVVAGYRDELGADDVAYLNRVFGLAADRA